METEEKNVAQKEADGRGWHECVICRHEKGGKRRLFSLLPDFTAGLIYTVQLCRTDGYHRKHR
jgi:hypothetical protein